MDAGVTHHSGFNKELHSLPQRPDEQTVAPSMSHRPDIRLISSLPTDTSTPAHRLQKGLCCAHTCGSIMTDWRTGGAQSSNRQRLDAARQQQPREH